MKAAIKSTPQRAKARFAQLPRPSGRPCGLHRGRRIAEAAATNVADPQGVSHQTGDAGDAQLTLGSRSGHGGLDIGWKGQRSVHYLSPTPLALRLQRAHRTVARELGCDRASSPALSAAAINTGAQ
jgi:hypothetical protein